MRQLSELAHEYAAMGVLAPIQLIGRRRGEYPLVQDTVSGLVIIGEHLHVDRIFYTTHVRPFGLLCSEALSVHARIIKLT